MTKKELLRGLPKIDEVLKQESLVVLSEEKGELLVTDAVRAVIAALRASILDLGDGEAEDFDAAVLSLNSLTKPGRLIPCGPRVEPTGGPGVALPAGSCNLTIAVTFFAIAFSSLLCKTWC